MLATCPAGAGAGLSMRSSPRWACSPVQFRTKSFVHMDLVMYLAGGSSTSSPRGFVAGSDVITTVNSDAAHAIATAIGQWKAADGRRR